MAANQWKTQCDLYEWCCRQPFGCKRKKGHKARTHKIDMLECTTGYFHHRRSYENFPTHFLSGRPFWFVLLTQVSKFITQYCVVAPVVVDVPAFCSAEMVEIGIWMTYRVYMVREMRSVTSNTRVWFRANSMHTICTKWRRQFNHNRTANGRYTARRAIIAAIKVWATGMRTLAHRKCVRNANEFRKYEQF